MKLASVDADPLFVAFVNSEWYDGKGRREDRLLDPEWRRVFAREWGFAEPEKPSVAEFTTIRELRAILRDTIEGLHRGQAISSDRVTSFAAKLPAIQMRLTITGQPPRAEWTVDRASWSGVAAEVVRSYLDFAGKPAVDRLSRCDNDGCRWAFVDMSRNRSRRWCEPTVCGNVSKVRAYRERQKQLRRSRR